MAIKRKDVEGDGGIDIPMTIVGGAGKSGASDKSDRTYKSDKSYGSHGTYQSDTSYSPHRTGAEEEEAEISVSANANAEHEAARKDFRSDGYDGSYTSDGADRIFRSDKTYQTYTTRRSYRWEKIGKYALYALIFTSPWFFLPLTNSPIDASKHLLTAVLLAVCLVCLFAIVIERRALAYPASRMAIAVAALLGVVILATIFSQAPMVSAYGNFMRTDSLFDFLLFGIAFFLAFQFWREEDIPEIGMWFLAGMGVLNLYGLAQIFGFYLLPWNFTRVAGFVPIGSLFAWGILMAAEIFLAVATPLERLTKRGRYFLFASVALAAIGLIILNFQYLWIALALGLIAIAGVRFASGAPLRLAALLALAAICLSLISPYFPSFASVHGELRPTLTETFSVVRQSLSSWHIAVGSGPATFSNTFARFKSSGGGQTLFWNIRFHQGHDFFLTFLATTGVLGVLALLFLIAVFAKRISAIARHPYGMAALMPVAFLMAYWFFYGAFFSQFIFIFLGLGLMTLMVSPRKELPFSTSKPHSAFLFFIGFILAVGVGLSGAYLVAQKYIAAVQYGNASQALAAQDGDKAVQYLNSVITLDRDTDEYWRAASQASLLAAQKAFVTSGGQSAEFQNAVTNAIGAAQRAIQLDPINSLNWNALGMTYEAVSPVIGKADEFAENAYKKTFELDPQNPDVPVSIARTLLFESQRLRGADQNAAQNKIGEAKSFLTKSIALKADYAPARFLLAQVYIGEGNAAGAAQVLQEVEAAYPGDSALAYQIGVFYYQNGDLGHATDAFARAVALDPNYANAHYFLGQIYERQGARDKALTEYQKVLATNPSNADIKKLVSDLEREISAPPGKKQ